MSTTTTISPAPVHVKLIPRLAALAHHAARLAEADALVGMVGDGRLERGLGDAEIGEAAEYLDELVALIEHVEAVAQGLDRVPALEHDPAAADDAFSSILKPSNIRRCLRRQG